jgi:hypothetical protein
VCDGAGGCTTTAKTNGTGCNDGNTCTHDDVCTGGMCGGTSYSCMPTQCQATSVCDGAGGCTTTPKPNGTACDVGVCAGGSCCTQESDQAFCSRLGKHCGQVSGTDNLCSQPKTANCGSCNPGLTCTPDQSECRDDTPPLVNITAPADLADLGHGPNVTIDIHVDDPAGVGDNLDLTVAEVVCPATRMSGAGINPAVFQATCPLHEGQNSIRAVGYDLAGHQGSATIRVTADLVAPTVTLVWPPDGGSVGASAINLQLALSEEATVVSSNIAGFSGTVSAGVHTYAVTLQSGANAFNATVADAAGNQATRAFTVTYLPRTRVVIVSGDPQVGVVDDPVQPLVVRVDRYNEALSQWDPAGAGVSVEFDGPLAYLTVTDATSQATTAGLTPPLTFEMGARQVRAFVAGVPSQFVQFDLFGAVDFDPGTPGLQANPSPSAITKIEVFTGSETTTTVGADLEKPIRVVATDAQGSVVQGASVSFAVRSVTRASAQVGTLTSTSSQTTDATGVAQVTFRAGTSTDTTNPDPATPSQPDAELLMKRNPDDPNEEPQRVGVNWVQATGANSTSADVFMYAFPGEATRVYPCWYDRVDYTGADWYWEALFATDVFACTADAQGNPVANVPVTFTVLPAEDKSNGNQLPVPRGTPVTNPQFLPARFDGAQTPGEHTPVLVRTDPDRDFVAARTVRTDYLGVAAAWYALGNMPNVRHPFSITAPGANGSSLTSSFAIHSRAMNSEGATSYAGCSGGTALHRDLYQARRVYTGNGAPYGDVGPAGYTEPTLEIGVLVLREDLLRDASGNLVKDINNAVQGNRTVAVTRRELAGRTGPVLHAAGLTASVTPQSTSYDQTGLIHADVVLGSGEGLNDVTADAFSHVLPPVRNDGSLPQPADPDFNTNAQTCWFSAGSLGFNVWSFSTTNTYKIASPRPDNPTDPDEYVYDWWVPADLTIRFRASFEPDQYRRRARWAQTRWVVSAIGDSHTSGTTTRLRWSRSWPGEPTIGRGQRPTATFRGLPQQATEFGLKTVQLYWRTDRGTDWPIWTGTSAPYEVFFQKDAKNHPPDPNNDPNWFYYWSQVVTPAILVANSTYCSGGATCPARPDMVFAPELALLPEPLMGRFRTGNCYIEIGPGACRYGQPPLAPNPLNGIDTFAYYVVHESQHYVWSCEWWRNSSSYWSDHKGPGHTGPDEDLDGDGLPNRIEDPDLNGIWERPSSSPTCPAYPSDGEKFDLSAPVTEGSPFPATRPDDEWKDYCDHANVTGAAFYGSDWAYPGKNSRLAE